MKKELIKFVIADSEKDFFKIIEGIEYFQITAHNEGIFHQRAEAFSLLGLKYDFIRKKYEDLKEDVRRKEVYVDESIEKRKYEKYLIVFDPSERYSGNFIIFLGYSYNSHSEKIKEELNHLFDFCYDELINNDNKFTPENLFTDDSILLLNRVCNENKKGGLEEVFIEYHNEEYLQKDWEITFDFFLDMSRQEFEENKNDQEEVANFVYENFKWNFEEDHLYITPINFWDFTELNGYDIDPLLKNHKDLIKNNITQQIINDASTIFDYHDDRLIDLISNYNWDIRVDCDFPNIEKLMITIDK